MCGIAAVRENCGGSPESAKAAAAVGITARPRGDLVVWQPLPPLLEVLYQSQLT